MNATDFMVKQKSNKNENIDLTSENRKHEVLMEMRFKKQPTIYFTFEI